MVKVALPDIQEDPELFINMTKKPTYVEEEKYSH
jgi:hypothetical protein